MGDAPPEFFIFLVFAPVFYHAPYFTINFEELVQEILLHISFAPTFYFILFSKLKLGGGGEGGGGGTFF
jgi:hypothetical protein